MNNHANFRRSCKRLSCFSGFCSYWGLCQIKRQNVGLQVPTNTTNLLLNKRKKP